MMKSVCFCELDLTPEICARLGCALGEAAGTRIGILSDGSRTAEMLKYALLSGIISSGAAAWNFGSGFESQISFFTAFCSLDTGIYIAGTSMSVYGTGGMLLPAETENAIIASFMSRHRATICNEREMKTVTSIGNINIIYQHELMRRAPEGLFDTFTKISCENSEIKNLLRDTVVRLGGSEGRDVTFCLSDSGETLSAVDECGGTVDHDTLVAICCCDEMRRGNDIAVRYDAPDFLEKIAAANGRKIYRYFENRKSGQDKPEIINCRKIWMNDALFLTVRVLAIMSERRMSLRMLLGEMPKYCTKRKVVAAEFDKNDFLTKIPEWEIEVVADDGAVIRRDGAKIMITPSKSGKNLCLVAEAASSETAAEICSGFEKLLQT